MAFPNVNILKVEILIAKLYCLHAFSPECLSKAVHHCKEMNAKLGKSWC